jgi:hypothetical protein
MNARASESSRARQAAAQIENSHHTRLCFAEGTKRLRRDPFVLGG